MSVSFNAYIHILSGRDTICFRHAAIRAVMMQEHISMELRDSSMGRDDCVDCKKEAEARRAEARKSGTGV